MILVRIMVFRVIRVTRFMKLMGVTRVIRVLKVNKVIRVIGLIWHLLVHSSDKGLLLVFETISSSAFSAFAGGYTKNNDYQANHPGFK